MRKEVSNPEFWNDRYSSKTDNWTLNRPNPVLFQAVEEKLIAPPGKFMAAGIGKGYDAIYASKAGFDVTAVDFSKEALDYAKGLAAKENVKINFVQDDLFHLKNNWAEQFDFIYEYVTFCAVDPVRREELFENFAAALKKDGVLFTVPFPIDERKGGPPFSLSLEYFYVTGSKFLKLEYYSKNINSLKPRKGNEVLMIFRKR